MRIRRSVNAPRLAVTAAYLIAALFVVGAEALWAKPARVVLADPARMMRIGERYDFVGANRLTVERTQQGRCLRSTPQVSATGLYQDLKLAPEGLFKVEWWWRVDRIHTSADIRELNREDFAAKIAFVFGEPTLFNRDVPTIAYVWTSTPVKNGSIVPSQRYSNLRYVQLHGRAEAGTWQHERRNVARDYARAFGSLPGPLRYVALFNDNDQTGEPVSALFGRIVASN